MSRGSVSTGDRHWGQARLTSHWPTEGCGLVHHQLEIQMALVSFFVVVVCLSWSTICYLLFLWEPDSKQTLFSVRAMQSLLYKHSAVCATVAPRKPQQTPSPVTKSINLVWKDRQWVRFLLQAVFELGTSSETKKGKQSLKDSSLHDMIHCDQHSESWGRRISNSRTSSATLKGLVETKEQGQEWKGWGKGKVSNIFLW